MIDIPCVIFAGGKSSRMGEDKSLLPFGEFETLTQYQLDKLQKIFKDVYISCKDKNKFNFEANFIEDIEFENLFAPTVGFVSIFKYLDAKSFFVISVDSPFVGEKEIAKLISIDSDGVDATIAKTEFGMQPLCGIYHRSLEKTFLEMLKTDNHKMGYLLKSSKTNFVEFLDEDVFLNLNNPSEYQKALDIYSHLT